jgi:hypothetical protein
MDSKFYADERPPTHVPSLLGPSREGPALDDPALPEEHFESDFGLFRILGNDLPPRHSPHQTETALKRILDAEPPLTGVAKIFILNRIADETALSNLRSLLDSHSMEWHVIPFELEEYQNRKLRYEGFPTPAFLGSQHLLNEHPTVQLDARSWAAREKILYAMNNNGARNFAINLGQKRFRWTLPFDGQTMFDDIEWKRIVSTVSAGQDYRHLVFPMNRGTFVDEPQVGFRFDSNIRFDEDIPYGRRPKVDLLMRLGIPGPHEEWARFVWDRPFPKLSKEAGNYLVAGEVNRLASGADQFDDRNLMPRTAARMVGTMSHLRTLDGQIVETVRKECPLGFYHPRTIEMRAALFDNGDPHDSLSSAREILRDFGMATVLDKGDVAPSGHKNDYFSLAPYWRRPRKFLSGELPGRYSDGMRAADTEIFGSSANRYDRQALFSLLNGVTLDWLLAELDGNRDPLSDSAQWVNNWFGDEPSRVSPHFGFSQVMAGSRGRLNGSLLIEMRDLAYFLDACTSLNSWGLFPQNHWAALNNWMENFYDWTLESSLCKQEKKAPNNLGTNYFLVTSALARFTGDHSGVVDALEGASILLGGQLESNGTQKHEVSRANSHHYSTFSLQLWCNLASIAKSSGFPLEDINHGADRNLRGALHRHISLSEQGWPFKSSGNVSKDRTAVLRHFLRALEGSDLAHVSPSEASLGAAEPHSGIPPGWYFSSLFNQAPR